MSEGIHSKHRERVRKEFLEHGFNDATPNHKLIEIHGVELILKNLTQHYHKV